MGGLTRFKVEEVDNGWIIEFQPRRGDLPSDKTRTEKHIAEESPRHLLRVIESLLLAQDRIADEDQPTS